MEYIKRNAKKVNTIIDYWFTNIFSFNCIVYNMIGTYLMQTNLAKNTNKPKSQLHHIKFIATYLITLAIQITL